MMGFWDTILRPAWRFWQPNVQYLNTVQEVVDEVYGGDGREGLSVASMWKRQPHLRTVVGFLSRNLGHVGLHLYERVGENDRKRDRSSVGAKLLLMPNGEMSMFDLLFALEADHKLYDRAYWWVRPTDDHPLKLGVEIRRLPPAWVAPKPKDRFSIKHYEVTNEKGESVEIPVSEVVSFTGYHPTDPLLGSPTIQALRDTLIEQIEAALYRQQVWKRGGRASAVITRPQGSKWSDEARRAFREDWYAKWTGRGDKAGGTPILGDGMDIKRLDFSAHEQQFVEAAKLSMATVASGFHVQPSMVGVLEGTNFAAVKEFRQMLYTETMGPDFEAIQQRLNGWLLPMLGMDPERFYFEFNIAKKLQGSFEEQAAIITTSVGAPWMTRNEARGRMNLSEVDGGDELVTPLNVLIGGQPSPRTPSQGSDGTLNELEQAGEGDGDGGSAGDDGGKGAPAGPQGPPDGPGRPGVGDSSPRGAKELTGAVEPSGDGPGTAGAVYPSSETFVKSSSGGVDRDELTGHEEKLTEILTGYFTRQRAAVLSRKGAARMGTKDGGGDDWWDADRWNRELGHDLGAWNVETAGVVALGVLAAVGLPTDAYDPELALAWLTTVGQGSAENINASTKERFDEIMKAEEPDSDAVDLLFNMARAAILAAAAMTTIAAFATREAGKQAGATTKTWITGKNPRDSHAAVNGQTVGMDELFSNGLKWPGDPAGAVYELAGCNCSLQVNWE